MREKPWQVIHLMTNETLGWYETDTAGWAAHPTEPVSVIYRPGRKRKTGRKFP